jgi:primosomal protein N' (replication factor Y)
LPATVAPSWLYSVALNVPAGDGLFTYRIAGGAEPGRRVLVPLGNRAATGVIVGPAAPLAGEVRDALRLLDEAPLLTADVLELVRFAAAHYLAPLGPAVKAALPPGLDVRESLRAQLTPLGREALERGQLDLAGQEDRTRLLLRKAASGAKLTQAQLASLARRGLAITVRETEEPRTAPEVEMAQAATGAEPPARAPRQAELVAWLLARAAAVPV